MTRTPDPILLRLLGVCLALLALGASPALAKKTDRVHVAEIVIVGEVKSLEQGRLKISTDFMGTVEADWEQVTRIESTKVFEVEVRDGTRYFGTIVDSNEDHVLAVLKEDGEVRVPFSEVVTFYQTKLTRLGKIDFKISLGFSFVQSSDVLQLTLDATADRRTKKFFSTLRMLSIVSNTADERTSRNDISYTALRALPGRWTYDAAGEFQTNESLGLDQRYLVRGSALYRAFRSEIRELSLGAGLAFSQEYFIDQDAGESSLEGTLSLQYFAFHFDNPKLQIAAKATAYPSLTVSGRYRAEIKADVTRELIDDLFWGLNFYWSYDNKPTGEEIEDSDLTITASLGWKL